LKALLRGAFLLMCSKAPFCCATEAFSGVETTVSVDSAASKNETDGLLGVKGVGAVQSKNAASSATAAFVAGGLVEGTVSGAGASPFLEEPMFKSK